MAIYHKTHAVHLFWPALLVACVTLFFASILFGDKNFTSDGQLAAYNQTISFWSGDWAAGWPIIADPLNMSLYPVRLVMSGLGFPFDAFLATAYVIAILGMFLFLRRLVDVGPASFGAMSFTLSGWMLVHLGHTSMVHAAAWLPWIMWGVFIISSDPVERMGRGMILLATVLSMSLLAGHLQITIYSLLLAYTFALYQVLIGKRPKKLYPIVISTLLGIGLSAPALMPTFELLSYTYRSALSSEDVFAYSMPLSALPGLVIPLLYGATPHGWFGPGSINPELSAETLTFFPAVMLILAGFAFLTGRQDRWHIYFWTVIGLAALALALGKLIPPAAFVTEHLFPFNMFRAPGRHMLEVTFCLSVMSAIGLHKLSEPRLSSRHQIWGAIFAFLFLFALAVTIALAYHDSLKLDLLSLVWPTLFALVMAALSIALVIHGSRGKPFMVALLSVGVLVFQTVTIGYQLPWKIYAAPSGDADSPQWVTDVIGELGYDYRALGANGWQSRVFNPDESRLHGLRTLGWYGPLINKPLAELSGLTTGGWIQRRVFEADNVVLDLLSVRYVSVPDEEKHLLQSSPERWAYIKSFGNEHVYENKNVLPRARIVCKTSSVADEGELNVSILNGRPIQPVKDHAYVNSQSEIDLRQEAGCIGQASIRKDSGDQLQIATQLDTDEAMLVISDLWYPGWQVTVDGHQRQLYRLNNVSRGVLINKGNSVVEFRYIPTYWRIAVFVSVLALVLLLALSMAKFRKRLFG